MTTIKDLSLQWWGKLDDETKDFFSSFGLVKMTYEEIENIFYNEVIVKWWNSFTFKERCKLMDSNGYDSKLVDEDLGLHYSDVKEIYLKEHTKEEQPANLYCVSSNALVYGKPCEKWCGSEHCLRNEQPKEEHCKQPDVCNNSLSKKYICPKPKEEMIKPTQPYFKGKGEHSVNELEKMCQQYKDYISYINSQPKEEVDVWDEAVLLVDKILDINFKSGSSDIFKTGYSQGVYNLYIQLKQHYTLIKK